MNTNVMNDMFKSLKSFQEQAGKNIKWWESFSCQETLRFNKKELINFALSAMTTAAVTTGKTVFSLKDDYFFKLSRKDIDTICKEFDLKKILITNDVEDLNLFYYLINDETAIQGTKNEIELVSTNEVLINRILKTVKRLSENE